MTGHAPHAAYAVKAVTYASAHTETAAAAAKERDWQYRRLLKHLRPIAFPTRGNN